MSRSRGESLEQTFRRVVSQLEGEGAPFAVAGAIAASIYRQEIRATQDLDFALGAGVAAHQVAKRVIERNGLTAVDVRQAQLDGGPLFAIKRHSTPVAMVCSRRTDDVDIVWIDFILPSVPWVQRAIERARDNAIDFGFGPVPTLTVEDVIVAKLAAFNARSDRFKDLDDLQSIFAAQHELDLAYFADRLGELELVIPKAIESAAPPELCKLSRAIARRRRKKR